MKADWMIVGQRVNPDKQERAKQSVERDRIISSRGLQVIRIRNQEIKNDVYRVIQRILHTCESAKKPSPTNNH